jgi:putative sterol carrier protein
MTEWKFIKRGDAVPDGAILAGNTKSDGDLYVARNSKGEVGKLNLDKDKMWNIWCHDGKDSTEGEILTVNGVPTKWVAVKKGELMPQGAFLCGETSTDGPVYAARHSDGAIGKLNVNGNKVNNFYYHGHGCQHEGEVLVIEVFQWSKIEKGMELPIGAVLAGRTSSDGAVYVARNNDGEVGKLNINSDMKANNIWCHSGNDTTQGEILQVFGKHEWKQVKKGDELPEDAIQCGQTKSDGVLYACRGEGNLGVGKLNTDSGKPGGKAHNFWFHGHGEQHEGEVLCVAGAGNATGSGGYA